jgi:hypothetical protein
LVLARERGWLLAWDDKDWIYLLNQAGDPQGQVHMPRPLTAVCCADDGSAFAVVGLQGEVWWLGPDLQTRWEQTLANRTVGAALDAFGQYLAVADARGRLYLFDRHGRRVFQVDSPRPLHHLAFVPAAPFLVGSSDYGLVACFDPAGRWVWRDGLVAHIGSLAVSGDGEKIVLACFTDGLQRYSLAGKKLSRLAVSEPYRLAVLTFDGRTTLMAGLGNRLQLLDADGAVLSSYVLENPPLAIAFSALGDKAFVALVHGGLVALDIVPS